MKESELAWVGPIPSQWHRQPLKTLFHQHKKKNRGLVETNLLSLSYGRIVRRDINQRGGLLPESFEGYNIVSDGDIVLRLTDLQNDQKSLRTGLVREKGIITSAYITLRANYSINTDYFQALLESYDYKKVFYSMGGGVRQGLNYDDISSLSLLVPPASEQDAIADFIYYKKSEIDRLIEKLRRQVELLEQYRRELIAHTVTHGLDPDVPMRDSGIDWIGMIPSHWKTASISTITDENKVKNSDLSEKNLLSLSYGKIIRKDIDLAIGLLPASFDAYQVLENGYIVLRMTDLQNDKRSLRSAIAKEKGIITGAYIGLKTRSSINPDYLAWLLRFYDLAKVFYSLGGGVRQSANYKEIGKIAALVPPLEAQEQIAIFLETKTTEIDSTISNISKQIELLGKYRKQVINDAVTGKVRVEGTE